MRRDMKLIYLLLTKLEGAEVNLKKFSQAEIFYHQRIMKEGGLIIADVEPEDLWVYIPSNVKVYRLTWEGHNYLARLRSQGVLQRINRIMDIILANIEKCLLKIFKDGRNDLG